MAERRIKVPFPTPTSPMVDAIDVSVTESTERWTEVKLEDGTTLKVRMSVLGALRIEGQYDQEGNPAYALKSQGQMVVVSAPDHLKKGFESARKVQ